MVSDMISNLGEWDWERLEHHLPISALESLVAIQPPKPEYGIDVPGWSVLVQSIWALMQRDWLVKVCHVLREENAAADKLAALGKGCGLNGSIFVVPPGAVASIVEHDQRRWMQWLLQWRGIPPSVARFHFAYLYYWFVVSSRCEMV
ncbi:hypothetical protein V6N13_089602 [Hibiscus sabdariffa]